MGKKKRILIVDDDSRNIFALAATLRVRDYECIPFADIFKALEFLKGDGTADVVLLDMMMPGMDGYGAIPEIRSIKGREHLPVIAVTAQAMPGDREKCLQAGADDYVSKPVDVDRLFQILGSI
jgi:CheY-like chemotaxis protein